MEIKGKILAFGDNNALDTGCYEDLEDEDVEYPLELRNELKKIAMECGLTEEQAELIYHCNEEENNE